MIVRSPSAVSPRLSKPPCLFAARRNARAGFVCCSPTRGSFPRTGLPPARARRRCSGSRSPCSRRGLGGSGSRSRAPPSRTAPPRGAVFITSASTRVGRYAASRFSQWWSTWGLGSSSVISVSGGGAAFSMAYPVPGPDVEVPMPDVRPVELDEPWDGNVQDGARHEPQHPQVVDREHRRVVARLPFVGRVGLVHARTLAHRVERRVALGSAHEPGRRPHIARELGGRQRRLPDAQRRPAEPLGRRVLGDVVRSPRPRSTRSAT